MSNEVLLSVNDLSVAFKTRDGVRSVVKNLSFDLHKGQTLAIVGESGSGKSISAFSILGLLPYPVAFHPTGSIIYKEKNEDFELLNKSENYLNQFRGKKIGMIFQEPLSALNPLHTIEQQISEPLFIHNLEMGKKKIKERVLELLDMVEFKDANLNAYPHQLSGGQRQRVMIALALACNPSILIADEPTTALDVTIQAGIIDLLKRLSKTQSMTTLLISHDLHMVKKLADTVCVMKQGECVESGYQKDVLYTPSHPYTKGLIDAEPTGSAKPIEKDAPVILKANNMFVSFETKKLFSFKKNKAFTAVDNINLSLKQGETLGIVGESGSGKTTLVFALLKLIESKGSIQFDNIDLTHLSVKQMRPIRARLQVIFQDPFGALNPRLSIKQIIEEGLNLHHPHLQQIEKDNQLKDILKDVHLEEDCLNRYPHEFSGGQRQRISIARSLILKPKVLALDEPTSALDRSIQAEILDLLKNLQDKYKLSYLFVSHDLSVIKALSHRIIIMRCGQVVEEGETNYLLKNPKSEYTKNLFNAAFS